MDSFDLGLGATVAAEGGNKAQVLSIGQKTENINNTLILKFSSSEKKTLTKAIGISETGMHSFQQIRHVLRHRPVL